jgi:spore germination protein GerM
MKQMRNTNFFRLILSVAAVLMILAANSAPASAQKRSNVKSPKTRYITIYVYELQPVSAEGWWRLVPVRRKIVDSKPLGAALKELLKGANDEEQNRNLGSFITGLEFVSARIRNKTAQINFKFTDEEIAEESWEGGGFDHANFIKAVEQTARQFAGVEQVSICVNGIENYADFGSTNPVKCSFGIFRRNTKRAQTD